jgi:hypothetical protein
MANRIRSYNVVKVYKNPNASELMIEDYPEVQKVAVSINGESYAVYAHDLKKAIDNALNV